MALIEFLLNLAGLLLWINWRTLAADPLRTAAPATLAGTLRRAEPRRVRRWHFLAALVLLLVLRAEFYRLLGPALDWTGTLDLFATRIAFRSDTGALMLLYSLLDFGLWLGGLLLGLLLVSLVTRTGTGQTMFGQVARTHLGRILEWPRWVRLLLPFLAGALFWWLASWLLGRWELIPRPGSELVRVTQAALVGAGSYLAWKYVLAALLVLHWLQCHVYFGRHPFWNLVDETGRRLVAPLRAVPLHFGKLDLRPLLALILVLALAHALEHGIRPPVRLDVNGRPEPTAFQIPGLAAVFEQVSR